MGFNRVLGSLQLVGLDLISVVKMGLEFVSRHFFALVRVLLLLLLALGQERVQLFLLLLRYVLVFQVRSVERPNLLPLIDNGE